MMHSGLLTCLLGSGDLEMKISNQRLRIEDFELKKTW